MGLLNKVKKINNSIKKSIENNHQAMNQKLHNMEKDSKLKKLKDEEQCEQMYLQIIANKDKKKQLYNNVDIKFEYAEGNITEDEYEIQMEKYKQKVDKLLSSLSHSNVTCEDLYNLYHIK